MKIVDGNQISMNHQPSGGKEWVAKITGKDQKYGLKREFLRMGGRDWSSSGKTGTSYFSITEDGTYEFNEPWKGRGYLQRKNGKIEKVSAIQLEAV